MTTADPNPDPYYDDRLIAQDWESYSVEEHAIWRRLFERQSHLLVGRACDEYLAGLDQLGVCADGIPDFRRLNDVLGQTTGWQIVAVPGLISEAAFFGHMAERRFVATRWIRSPAQMDYLQEPDIFHDVFGHVPLLTNPAFADYLQAYGRGGLKALRLGALDMLARLYWYTVEFGLLRTGDGARIYGAGILSSKGESIYCLDDPQPNRIAFDLKRVLRTRYRIDDYQETYFVIDSFEQLMAETAPDFTPIYAELADLAEFEPGDIQPSDERADDMLTDRGSPQA
ncbi:MAG: phenylalanine 4-monooxygenase [Alphaproteobacteria bacterium]|nr:phenylalanine 4-monooxygenase [Alphaproteobacteria bacterium]